MIASFQHSKSLIPALLIAALLSACGGGGSDSGSTPTTSTSTPGPQLVQEAGAPAMSGNIATDGYNWINYRRGQVGLASLARNSLIDTAAQGHSDYLKANNTVSHDQVAGKPGFTGATLADRFVKAGYSLNRSNSYAYGEVIAGATNNSGFYLAEELITAIYHRFAIFEPIFKEAGTGAAMGNGGYAYFTADFAANNGYGPGLAAGQVVTYPVANQAKVATSFSSNNEEPDPVPNQDIVGYPISVHANINDVLGVPLGAQIGDVAGWRWAFGAMALLSGLVLMLHLAVIPALPAAGSATLRQFGKQLRNRQLQAGLLLTLLLVTSHFMAFTFVRPLLLSMSGLDTQWLGALLFAYGCAGIIGNFLAGVVAVRRTAPTIIAISAGLLLTPLLFLAVGDSSIGGGVVLLAWGLAYGGVSVGLMTLMMKAAPRAVEIVAALCVGVFNVAIALGAWAGGQAVDKLGLCANLWLAAGFAAAALLLSFRISLIEHAMKAADKQLGSATN